MTKNALIILYVLFFCACNTTNKKEDGYNIQSTFIMADKVQSIPVHIDENDYFNHIEDHLHTTSYIKLAPEPLLANIRDIHIYDNRIYIWDQTNQIVCYDMQGNVVYRIRSIGNGPGEYSKIHAFTINPDKEEIVIYDNLRISLLYYSMLNGKYLRTERFPKPNPSEMAFFDHTYFYNNRNHRNYPNDRILHNSLLVSTDGLHIDKTYFPHNDAEEEYIFSPSSQTLYDNGTSLYYCRNFDNTIYQLRKDSLKALYRIELPNPLPSSKIEEKTNEMELIQSDYSFGITNVYECDSLLYFRFLHSGYVMATLYNLAKKNQICCVKVMQDSPKSTLPLINTIDGVYNGTFFSILSPEFIDFSIKNRPGKYPAIFESYDAQSENPVIAFYEVKKQNININENIP